MQSKKSKARLRQPGVVHAAYAKVMKKLNFCGWVFGHCCCSLNTLSFFLFAIYFLTLQNYSCTSVLSLSELSYLEFFYLDRYRCLTRRKSFVSHKNEITFLVVNMYFFQVLFFILYSLRFPSSVFYTLVFITALLVLFLLDINNMINHL